MADAKTPLIAPRRKRYRKSVGEYLETESFGVIEELYGSLCVSQALTGDSSLNQDVPLGQNIVTVIIETI